MNRSTWITTGAVALVLLLAGAAFVGGRLLADPEVTGDNQQLVVSHSGGGEAISGSALMVETVHADEMPDRAPDVAGLFAQREDNRLFVGTGNLSGVKVNGTWRLHHDGPVFEVVTTHGTLVYRDDTLQQFGDVPPSGPVQQVLTPSTVDEIEENSTISAWGERRGDRLVAEVVVFSPNG
jgi:hypothetical protein